MVFRPRWIDGKQCTISMLLFFVPQPYLGQVTVEQLKALFPTYAEMSRLVRLPGRRTPLTFGRTMPAGSLRNAITREWTPDHEQSDEIELDASPYRLRLKDMKAAYGMRGFFTNDKLYRVVVDVKVAPSPELADKEMGRFGGGSAGSTPGTFSSGKMLGDFSFRVGGEASGSGLTLRCGNLIIGLSASIESWAFHQQFDVPFPSVALDAVACRMLLAASRLHDVTGVTSKEWKVSINGRATNVRATEVAGHMFVAASDICRNGGMGVDWLTDRGAMIIKGRNTVTLHAGSLDIEDATGSRRLLRLPPFMDGETLTIDLDDLMTALGGFRTTERDTIAVQILGHGQRPDMGEYRLVAEDNEDRRNAVTNLRRDQLLRILPTSQELTGLVNRDNYNGSPLVWSGNHIADIVTLSTPDMAGERGNALHASAARTLTTVDGMHSLTVAVDACDSATSAQGRMDLLDRYGHDGDRVYTPVMWPDDSFTLADVVRRTIGPGNQIGIVFRDQCIFVSISGGLTDAGKQKGAMALTRDFLETIAFSVYLKAARELKHTGLFDQLDEEVIVGSNTMSHGPLYHRVFPWIDVREFAKLANIECDWDSKNGTLVLSRSFSPARVSIQEGWRGITIGPDSDGGYLSRHPLIKIDGNPWMRVVDMCNWLRLKYSDNGSTIRIEVDTSK